MKGMLSPSLMCADALNLQSELEILDKLGRGVTVLDGSGAYTGSQKRVLMCAARPNQVVKITKGVKIIDKNAFVVVTTANSIMGEGFYNSEKE